LTSRPRLNSTYSANLNPSRSLTQEDTVEFFSLVLELKLNEQEIKVVVAFMRALQVTQPDFHRRSL
jgi:hypothetical protein